MTTYKIKKSTFENSYSVIKDLGKKTIKVRSVSTIYDEKLGKDKAIINFKAVAANNIAAVKNVFKGVDEVEASDLNGLLLTYNVPLNTGKELLPCKDESVECTFDRIVSKRSGEEIIIVSSMRVLPAVKAELFSFDDEDEQLTPETEEEEETVKI